MTLGAEESQAYPIVPVEKVETKKLEIDSYNFLSYIYGLYDKEAVHLSFSNQLHLPYLTKGLQELASTTQQGDMFTLEQKEEFLKQVEDGSVDESDGKLLVNSKAAVERARTIIGECCQSSFLMIRIKDLLNLLSWSVQTYKYWLLQHRKLPSWTM